MPLRNLTIIMVAALLSLTCYMRASRNRSRRRGRTRAAGVGRFKSSTITRGRDVPWHISGIRGRPTGRSSLSAICSSVKAGNVAGHKIFTSQ